MTGEKAELKTAAFSPAESRIQIHNFSDTLLNSTVYFHVMKMQESFFIWIGNKENFDNLAMAMKTKFVSIELHT